MPIVFKYKNPINVSYAPGRTNIGEDGELGSIGKAGNALYFTNLELDNSYNIELTLQKIENNIILSSSNFGNTTKIREYKINDLILSSSGKCYKIIQSTSESLFKNYKYDIEYVGQFKTKSSVNAIRVVFKKITDISADNPVPNNAALVKNSYDNSDYKLRTLSYEVKLYGIEYSPDSFYSKVVDDSEITPEEKDKRDNAIKSITSGEYVPYRYSIQIRLKNTKQFYNQASPVTVETLNNTPAGTDAENADNMRLSFYKTIEIPDVDLFKDSFYVNDKDDELAEYCSPTVFTISDSMLDRLHPSKNNVYCSLSNGRDMWYKTGMHSEDGKFSENDFKFSEEDANKCAETEEKYGNSTVYIELKDRTYEEDGVPRKVDYNNLISGFPKYTTASVDTEHSSLIYKNSISENIESELTNPNSKLLIKDRNNLAGTSLYFTSILDDNDCKREMENFLFSQNTTVYVIAKNLKTKEIVVSEIPYELEEEQTELI